WGPDLELIYKSYDTAWGGNSECEDQPRSGYIKVKVEPKVLDQFGYPKARATSCFVMANGTLTLHGKNLWKAAPLLTVDTLGMDGLGFAPLSSNPKFLKIWISGFDYLELH
ncbi:hypothetical protein FGLOB1_6455, partial [Fusarium globosum]